MRKRLFFTLFLLAGLLAARAPALGEERIRDLKSFKLRVDDILRKTCPKGARLGLHILSLNKGDVLLDHKGGELFVPASNVKLITTAAALRALGPDYTFKTSLYFEGGRSGGTLKGNLYLKGSGDPTLVSERMWLLARAVGWRGIRRIEGDLVADDGFFEEEEERRKPEGIAAYGAISGALSLNFNVATLYVSPGAKKGNRPIVVLDPESEYLKIENMASTGARGTRLTLRVHRADAGEQDTITLNGRMPLGSRTRRYYVSITHPWQYTARTFKTFLLRRGVSLEGGVRRGRVPPDAELLLVQESRPLSAIIADLNKLSNNFVAEQLLRTLGAEVQGEPGSAEKGLAALRAFLWDLGLPAGSFRLADGSGLSRRNRLSPKALVRVLGHMFGDFRLRPEYVASLSVMGVDGTAERRLGGTPAERRIRVKTGLLHRVQALSGYAVTRRGETLAFSILVNDRSCGYDRIRRLQNALGMAMVNLDRPLASEEQMPEAAAKSMAKLPPFLKRFPEGPALRRESERAKRLKANSLRGISPKRRGAPPGEVLGGATGLAPEAPDTPPERAPAPPVPRHGPF